MNQHDDEESPAQRGLASSFLRAAVTGLLIVAVLAYLGWAGSSSIIRAKDRIHRIEVSDLFTQAVAEGLIPNPPAPADSFLITSQHGGQPYIVSYTTAQGQRTGYSVTRDPSGLWEFHSLTDEPSHTFQSRTATNNSGSSKIR